MPADFRADFRALTFIALFMASAIANKQSCDLHFSRIFRALYKYLRGEGKLYFYNRNPAVIFIIFSVILPRRGFNLCVLYISCAREVKLVLELNI